MLGCVDNGHCSFLVAIVAYATSELREEYDLKFGSRVFKIILVFAT